ncbi:MAG: hypothetical protein Q7R43_00180 [Candidatus Daviesbacteria bacterium]|nr:hypothetical protein [Candidatus Daviesbacteria bacterium]
MGRNTQNFRQSKRSISGSQGASNYAQINRSGNWYGKIVNLVKPRGKGGVYGKS